MWRRVTSLSPLISVSRSSATLNQAACRFTIFEYLTTLNPTMARGGIFPEEKNPFITFGRVDDNIDTIKKRLKVFKSLNLPVINHYSQRGKLYMVNAVGTLEEIFEQVRPAFANCELSDSE